MSEWDGDSLILTLDNSWCDASLHIRSVVIRTIRRFLATSRRCRGNLRAMQPEEFVTGMQSKELFLSAAIRLVAPR